MNLTPLEQAVLQFVNQPGYRPMKPRIIARNLDIPKDQAADVKKAVKRLVRFGQIQYAANHLVMPIFSPEAAKVQATTEDAALKKPSIVKDKSPLSPKPVSRSPGAASAIPTPKAEMSATIRRRALGRATAPYGVGA
jgi:hypothetical protein